MAGLSRKHFELIAKALNETKPLENCYELNQWVDDVDAIARALKQTNPQFQIERFKELCKADQVGSKEG